MSRKRIRWNRRVFVDTESNPDGSLYIISYYDPELDEYQLFYNLKDFHDFLIKKDDNTLCYVHNFGK